MTDMKQVAERLRKMRPDCEMSTDAWVALRDEVYGAGNYAAALDDDAAAVLDWLAERDPTPLTVEIIKETGAEYTAGFACFKRGDYVLCIEQNYDGVGNWGCGDGWIPSIRTVGQLRTLARLAGVELKKGGE